MSWTKQAKKDHKEDHFGQVIKLTDILREIILEDRCKRIADRRYNKPSAYKSGAIVTGKQIGRAHV